MLHSGWWRRWGSSVALKGQGSLAAQEPVVEQGGWRRSLNPTVGCIFLFELARPAKVRGDVGKSTGVGCHTQCMMVRVQSFQKELRVWVRWVTCCRQGSDLSTGDTAMNRISAPS